MLAADEKKAFDAMMSGIDSDDSENDDDRIPQHKSVSLSGAKGSDLSDFSTVGAKGSRYNNTGAKSGDTLSSSCNSNRSSYNGDSVDTWASAQPKSGKWSTPIDTTHVMDDSNKECINSPHHSRMSSYENKAFENNALSSSSSSSSYDSSNKPPKPTSSYAKPSSTLNTKTPVLSQEEQEIENFGCMPTYSGNFQNGLSSTSQVVSGINSAAADDISITKRWLMKPCAYSSNVSLKCFIEREKGTFGIQPTIYRCFLETDPHQQHSKNCTPQGRFMMSAKKKIVKTNSSSYYLISVDRDPSDDRGKDSVLGKMRGNNIGDRYLLTDNGLAPDKTVLPSMLRKEYGIVGFEFYSGGPSKIDVYIPYVSASSEASVWQPTKEGNGIDKRVEQKLAAEKNNNIVPSDLLVNSDKDDKQRKLFLLKNKQPRWDDSHGGHVLNFMGRVTESSVKNFQMICDTVLENVNPDGSCSNGDGRIAKPSSEDIILQFGRVAKNRFTMDLKFPMSPMQAFAVCVACLDGKIADRKGYEYINRFSNGVSDVSAWVMNMGSTKLENSNDKAPDPTLNFTPSSQRTAFQEGCMTPSSTQLPSGKYLKDKFSRSFK